jgi:hypothetical protein
MTPNNTGSYPRGQWQIQETVEGVRDRGRQDMSFMTKMIGRKNTISVKQCFILEKSHANKNETK